MSPSELNATSQPLMGKLLIDTAMGSFLGDKRIRLLEAIAQHGTVNAEVTLDLPGGHHVLRPARRAAEGAGRRGAARHALRRHHRAVQGARPVFPPLSSSHFSILWSVPMTPKNLVSSLLAALLLVATTAVRADEISVAVAANFTAPFNKIAAGFQHLGAELQAIHHGLGQAGGAGALQIAGVVGLQCIHVLAQQPRQRLECFVFDSCRRFCHKR